MDEKKSTYLENVISGLFNRAKKYGYIQFNSLEEEQNLKSELMELEKKLTVLYRERRSLADDSRYFGRVGQSREAARYYKKTAKDAKRKLKKMNKEIAPLRDRYEAILNELRNDRS